MGENIIQNIGSSASNLRSYMHYNSDSIAGCLSCTSDYILVYWTTNITYDIRKEIGPIIISIQWYLSTVQLPYWKCNFKSSMYNETEIIHLQLHMLIAPLNKTAIRDRFSYVIHKKR